MKIGILLPVGRTDKYGYQYDELTKLILSNQEDFGDHIYVIGSSRYIKKDLFESSNKIDFISNEKTWFTLERGEEIFSFQKIIDNTNFFRDKLQEEGYDVAIQIHINQYVPKRSIINIKKACQKMLKKKKPFIWLYKSYQCGNLLFNADRRVPWIVNLTKDFPWRFYADSLKHKETGKIILMQMGDYKKYNNQAIIDLYSEFTMRDSKEKHDFTIKELRILNKTYNPNNLENLKFDEKIWMDYLQNKLNKKSLSNIPLDELGKKIVAFRKKEFLSNILEKNYKKQ